MRAPCVVGDSLYVSHADLQVVVIICDFSKPLLPSTLLVDSSLSPTLAKQTDNSFASFDSATMDAKLLPLMPDIYDSAGELLAVIGGAARKPASG